MRRVTASLLFITVSISGCYKWSNTTALRPALGNASRDVRIVFEDSSRTLVHGAHVVDDSLVGWVRSSQAGTEGFRKTTYELPLEGAARVEVREPDNGVMVGIGVTAAAMILYLAVICSRDNSIFSYC